MLINASEWAVKRADPTTANRLGDDSAYRQQQIGY